MQRRLATWLETIWWQKRKPPATLRAFAPLYRAASRLHLAWREAHRTQAPIPVISVGNITVGGSGKTPFVAWLAQQLAEAGLRPAILSRGLRKDPEPVPKDGDPARFGDEPVMLAQQGLFVIAGRDRIRGAALAASLGAEIAILDDGMQYRRLARALEIVLVPAEGFGNGMLLPAGPLREPISALARADLIVRTGVGAADPLGFAPEFRFCARPDRLVPLVGAPADAPPPPKALAAAGIARPARFFASLQALGIEIVQRFAFPDHHRYRAADVQRLVRAKVPVVTTMKDAVKLARLWPEDAPALWALALTPEPAPGLWEAIQTRLAAILRKP